MGKGFRELKVWQHAKGLAVQIYTITNGGIFSKDFGLRDQIRRAAVSVASNIAEGDERDTNKDAVRFLYTAKGSLAEVLTQTIIANEIGYLQEGDYKRIVDDCEVIGKMLGSLIKARSVSLATPDE
jgi:four helix bundle protein